MTIWYIDIMWALMLFGVALFTGCMVVMNPALRAMRLMGLVVAYCVGAWMVIVLPWRIALATWCLFAAAGGAIVMLYEVWARYRHAGSGRVPRPFVMLQGFVLWPAMIPDAVEGMLVDARILPAARSGIEPD
jgi:hypothetical protein